MLDRKSARIRNQSTAQRVQGWRTTALPLLLLAGVAACASHTGSSEERAGTVQQASHLVPPFSGPPTDTLLASQSAGYLPSTSEVTPFGQYSHTIPIAVPEGRAGVKPAISLVYNSGNGNGSLGIGWSLSGLSKITVCRESLATHNRVDGVKLDGTGRFCLDGQPLVEVTQTTTNREYRPERADFSRIFRYPASGPPDRFEVWLKDGQVRVYGGENATTHSRGEAIRFNTQQVLAYAWNLSRTSDRHGNTIDYFYEAIPDSVERLPLEIKYTGSTLTSYTANRSIKFVYENRPDPISGYVAGLSMANAKRLKRVEAHAPHPATTALVWAYDLGYGISPASPRSRIETVRWCDSAGVCLPETKVGWGNSWNPPLPPARAPNEYRRVESWQIGPITNIGTKVFFFDVNGDGRDDLMYNLAEGTDGQCPAPAYFHPKVNIVLSTGLGFRNPGSGTVGAQVSPIDVSSLFRSVGAPSFLCNEAPNLRPFHPELTHLADFNADSKVDVLASGCFAEGSGYKILRWTGQTLEASGFFLPRTRSSINLADVNGDGIADVFDPLNLAIVPDPNNYSWLIRLSRPDGTFMNPIEPGVRPSCNGIALDLEGDGRFKVHEACDGYESFGINADGQTETAAVIPELQGFSGLGQAWIFLDINGDGLKDALFNPALDVGVSFTARLNTGNGFGPNYVSYEGPSLTVPPSPRKYASEDKASVRVADINADGMDDLLLLDRSHILPGGCGYEADTNPPVVLLSNGRTFERIDAFAGVSGWNRAFHHGPLQAPPMGFAGTATGDLDGDGLPEIVQLTKRPTGEFDIEVLSQRPNSVDHVPHDRITFVENGLGFKEFIGYRALPQDALAPAFNGFYQAGTSCTYPQSCLHRGGLVVESVIRDAWDFEQLSVESYTYEDARTDLKGRGFLGFGKIRVFDFVVGREVTTTYDNQTRLDLPTAYTYPFAGMAKSVVTTIAPAQIPFPLPQIPQTEERRIEVTTFLRTRLVGDGTYVVENDRVETREFASATGGQAFRERISTYSNFDEFSNARHETHATTGGEEITIDRTYFNNTILWLLGLVDRETVTSTAAGSAETTTRVSQHFYYPTGKLWQVIIEPDDPDADVRSTTLLGRDLAGLVTRVDVVPLLGDARTLLIDYDSDGVHPQRYENSLGHVSWVGYHPGVGKPAIFVDPNGVTTTWQYDRFGRLRAERPQDGSTTTVNYETVTGTFNGIPLRRALAVKTQEAGGGQTETYFNPLLHPARRRVKGFAGTFVEADYDYDEAGRLVSETLPRLAGALPKFIFHHYDNLHRPTQTTNADTTTATRTYPDPFTVRATDESGHLSELITNRDGRVVESAKFEAVTGQPPRRIATTYEYGPFGVLRLVRQGTPASAITEVRYDKLGRRSYLKVPDSGPRQFWHNAFGEVRAEQDPASQLTLYAYDTLGRPTLKTSPDGITDYDWDDSENGIGQLADTLSPDGIVTEHFYDPLGRPQITRWRVDALQYNVEFAYDTVGRLRTVSYPVTAPRARFQAQYVYNTAGYLEKVINPANQSAFWTAEIQEPFYERERLGNGLFTERLFDESTGRLTDINTIQGSSTLLQDLHYDYNPNGTVQRRADAATNLTETFQYDTLQRLTRWTSSGARTLDREYRYDDLDNIGRVLDWNGTTAVQDTTYAYAQTNNAGPHGPTSMGANSYHYDIHGRQIRRYDPGVSGSPRQTLTYNTFDLPKSIDHVGVGTTNFRYDASGARVRKTLGLAAVNYIGGLYEHRATPRNFGEPGFPLFRDEHVFYVHAQGKTVAQVTWERTLNTETADYSLTDALGSVTATTRQSGTGISIERLYYEPFGDRVQLSGVPLTTLPSTVTRGFTEHEHDNTAGLINMQGRMYDPKLRRFLTPDPIVAAPLDGQSFNPYSYVWNNPLSYVDPTGFAGTTYVDIEQHPSGSRSHTEVTTNTPAQPGVSPDAAGIMGPFGAFGPGTPDSARPNVGSVSAGTSTPQGYTPPGLYNQVPVSTGLFNGPDLRFAQSRPEGDELGELVIPVGPSDDAREGDLWYHLSGKAVWDDYQRWGARNSAWLDKHFPALSNALNWLDWLANLGVVGPPAGGVAARVAAPGARQIQAAWGASVYRHGGQMTGVEHIMYRHAANSGFANVSRFAEGTTARHVVGYVDQALQHGTVIQTAANAFTIEYNVGRVIGTNVAGNAASSIRVFVRDGIIQTAFPF